MPLQPKPLAALVYVHGVGAGKIAFGKAEIMDGVEQIGFAYAVTAANAHDAFCKMELLVKIVLELKNRYGIKIKRQTL